MPLPVSAIPLADSTSVNGEAAFGVDGGSCEGVAYYRRRADDVLAAIQIFTDLFDLPRAQIAQRTLSVGKE